VVICSGEQVAEQVRVVEADVRGEPEEVEDVFG
jgi:hypothetical protein